MPKIGKGVTQPAKFEDIIEDLFQNEKIRLPDDSHIILVFSVAHLSTEQQQALTYPGTFTPLDAYVIYVTNKYDADGTLILSATSLISFVSKDDGFIYGYYFDVTGVTFDLEELKDSKRPICLPSEAVVTSSNYYELFTKVKETTVILGLSTEPIGASLQYSHDHRYYYASQDAEGIINPLIPETKLTGLSENMKRLKEKPIC